MYLHSYGSGTLNEVRPDERLPLDGPVRKERIGKETTDFGKLKQIEEGLVGL